MNTSKMTKAELIAMINNMENQIKETNNVVVAATTDTIDYKGQVEVLQARLDKAVVEYKKLRSEIPQPVVTSKREVKGGKYTHNIQVAYKGIVTNVLLAKDFATVTGYYKRNDTSIMMKPVLATMFNIDAKNIYEVGDAKPVVKQAVKHT